MESLIDNINDLIISDEKDDIKIILERATKPKMFAGQDLTCTKPCQFAGKKEDGTRGCCYRTECSFAHSWSELRYVECKFEKCYRKNTCPFKHRDESGIAYFKRTKKAIPDLPETSEETRKQRRKDSAEMGDVLYGKELREILEVTHKEVIDMTEQVAKQM